LTFFGFGAAAGFAFLATGQLATWTVAIPSAAVALPVAWPGASSCAAP
jgi:hypothetical protein